jgi:hypothetical protein
MSTDPDALFDEILQRLQAMETTSEHTRLELNAVWGELKMHIREEPEQFERIRMSIENGAKHNHKQIEIIAHELQELRLARSRDKGFWAGAAFVFTAIGGAAVTVWHKWHGG